MTKVEILTTLEESRAALLDAIDGLSQEQILTPSAVGEWSVRDVLQHLSLWEAELVRMLAHLDQGRRPTGESFAPNPDFDSLNARWHAETKDRPLDRVMEDLHGVRRQTVRWISQMGDEDLTRRRPEVWLRGEPVGQWIADYTYDHEREHTEHIRAYRKSLSAA